MNFKKLQAMQLELDNSILSAKPQMTAEERFNKTLVALSVEVSEVANCAEHFKFWKDNKGKVDEDRFGKQEMYADDELVDVNYIEHKTGVTYTFKQAHKLTLVEEASDCLHFILSLANQLDVKVSKYQLEEFDNLEDTFLSVQQMIVNLSSITVRVNLELEIKLLVNILLTYFYYLGITTQELEQAYYEKNKVNYERLREGY